MRYRTYISNCDRYKLLGTYTMKSLIVALDYLILTKNTDKRIMVVEEDREKDFPIFLYKGKEKEYQDFRKKCIEKIKVKK